MIGLGLGGGGGGAMDSAITVVGILGTDRVLNDLRRLSMGWHDVSRAQNAAARSAMIGSNWGTGLIAGATLGTLALGRLGMSSIKAAGQLEATRTGLESVLGSAEKARSVYDDIAKFSLLSPMNNAEVAKSAQLLLATGTAAERLIPTMHAIGNAVAFTGAANPTQKFVEITRIFAKLESRGRITSRELNQIATRGINPFKMLREELNLTGDQVANIGKMGIKSSEAIPALIRGFEKLGNGQAMERLNKTYIGQVAKLEDATDQLKASLGSIILPDVTKFVEGLGDAVIKAKELAQQNPGGARIGMGLAAAAIPAMFIGGMALKWRYVGRAMAAGAASGGGVGGRGVVAKDIYIVAGRVFLSGPMTGGPVSNGTRPLPVPAPVGAAGAAGAAGAGAAGGAGGAGAAGGGAFASGVAFGMGPVLTAAIVAAGAAAAFKLPGYMRDATTKSDEQLGQSSDPTQQLHLYGGEFAQRLLKRLGRGASVLDKVIHGSRVEDAQRRTTDDEDRPHREAERARSILQNSAGQRYLRWVTKWEKELPALMAASEKWSEENIKGYRAMREAQELAAQRLSVVSNNGLHGLRLATATEEQVVAANFAARRNHVGKWARQQFGARLGANFVRNWEKENAPPEMRPAATPRQDWDANTVRLAAAFGQGPGANGVALAGQRNRDDSITIQASNAEMDHRNLRGRNMVTPRRLP